MGTEERLTIYFFAGVIVFIIVGFLYNKWEQKRATSYFKRKMDKNGKLLS
ncbi:MAG TPA: hypothetical protein PK122_06740 [Candidatus Paceibacterota bacterium]|nr:hypothetical protein [Candidatus Paceibacterota bacterium]